jgi:hypothetical protein
MHGVSTTKYMYHHTTLYKRHAWRFYNRTDVSSFLKKATLTEGKVLHVLGSSYRIQYFTGDGTEKIYEGSGKSHGFREGNPVSVWYRTDKPGRVRLSDGKKGSKRLYTTGVACIVLGVYPLFMKKKVKTER